MKGWTQNTDNFSPISGFYQLGILVKPVVLDFSGVYGELFFKDINKNKITIQDLTLFQANRFQNDLLNS